MDLSFSNGGGGGGGDGVSVSKYSISMNTFLWYFFQTLTLSSMLLMVLSIYYYAFASSTNNNNIQIICVISVAFSIISPSFIIPKLPTLAAMAISMIQLYENVFFQLLNMFVWLVFGFLYPFPANILCYCLIAGVGLLKLYSSSTDEEESSSFRLMGVISRDALVTSFFVFEHEKIYGAGRWVDSSTGCALLGLFVVTLLAQCLPPLVKPEKKKKMMNEIEAILTDVTSAKKIEEVNVAEAPILGSGTKSLLETV